MNKVVENLALALWGIYCFFAVYREIKNDNDSVKNILKHPFHFIRIDNIFFLLVFLVYNNFARVEILPYLYLILTITNIVYLFYDLVDNYKFTKIKKNEYLFYVGVIATLFICFYYLNNFDNIIKIAIVTLLINLFIPAYVSLLKHIKNH